jgi:hypothetical protein
MITDRYQLRRAGGEMLTRRFTWVKRSEIDPSKCTNASGTLASPSAYRCLSPAFR